MIDMKVEKQLKTKGKRNDKGITIGSNCKLTLLDSKKVSLGDVPVFLNQTSYEVMKRSHDFLKSFVNKRVPIYGINTQFGDQVQLLDDHLKSSDSSLYYDSINDRQQNLIKSHNCGMGAEVSIEIVRVAMFLRAHCLSQGYSGVPAQVVETFIQFLNAGIIPIVYCYGSIGASGDLIPLATIAGAMIGENVKVHYQNAITPAPLAMKLAGLKPLKPEMRDGLAMINGTSFMTAIASIALYDLRRLFKQMLKSIAMTLESLMVINSAYHPLIHHLKHHTGQQEINNFMNEFWQGSQLIVNLDELRSKENNNEKNFPGKEHPNKAVQDYYSLRSVAQGFGPFQENLTRAVDWIENEMNSVNDNPIVDALEGHIHHGANFMGYYVTDACDILKMNIGQASTWLHALLANLVHPRKSHYLPANLVSHPEKDNGFRPIQLLAASLAVQNRKLAQSHQSFSLPTEGDNQDVNSLGTHAAFDFRESVDNLERLTAIMLLASVQALEFRGIKKASKNAQNIYQIIRDCSKTVGECRPMHEELKNVVSLLKEEKI